ncbi:SIMPL domain-containing protein [Candidatus Woesearchaeota archaeon]|nr:SIMPL domain-containing protein [Candidatus Woesearchaeota archaeon]
MAKKQLDWKATAIIITVIIVGAMFITINSIFDNDTTISAQGSASMQADPDSAVVYVNANALADTATLARDEMSQQMANVKTALLNLGVKNDNIETQQFNVYEEYEWDEGTRESIGFRATQSIKVTTKDFDQVAKIVDAAIDGGALVSSINFELSTEKQNELKAELLATAAQDARAKADAVATGLDKKVSSVISVSTSDYGYAPYPIFRAEMAVADSGTQAIKAASEIEPRKLDLNAQVSVTFKIK